MNHRFRLSAFIAVSLGSHLLLVHALALVPRPPPLPQLVNIEFQINEAPSLIPAEPPKPVEPPAPAPEPRIQPIHEARLRKSTAVRPDIKFGPVPRETPPTERPAPEGEGTTTPVFGISMQSTSLSGDGPAFPVGNTLRVVPKQAKGRPGKVAPLAAPVQAYEVTKMPLPKGRCTGEYTEDARKAGLEGTVVLDLVAGEDGVVRSVDVVRGLDHGLTEAAVAAAKRCRFTPGERDGIPVPVRIRGFKIRFFLQGGAD
jgi:periplasmic protein TonB